jgi:hypothetical protein
MNGDLIISIRDVLAHAYEQHTGVKYDGDVEIWNMATIKEPTEDQIQADFFSWLALHEKKYPELALFYAIPNGTNKSPAARGLFKRTGLKSGVPDVHLPVSNDNWNGLWIEFKSAKGRLSESQKWWGQSLINYKQFVEVCRSWTEAANVTIDYLGLDIPKL